MRSLVRIESGTEFRAELKEERDRKSDFSVFSREEIQDAHQANWKILERKWSGEHSIHVLDRLLFASGQRVEYQDKDFYPGWC